MSPRLSAIRRVAVDGPIPLQNLLPVPGHPNASVRTLIRWIRDGKRGVRLDGLEEGGRWHSSPQALSRFLRAVGDAEAA